MSTPTLEPTHTPTPAFGPITINEALTMLEQALNVTNGAKAHVTPLNLDADPKRPGSLAWRGRDGEPQVLMSFTEHGTELLMSWSCHGADGWAHVGKITNREMLVACSMPSACQIAALPNEEGVKWLGTRAAAGAEAGAVMFAFCALVSAVRAACFPKDAASPADGAVSPLVDATGAKAL